MVKFKYFYEELKSTKSEEVERSLEITNSMAGRLKGISGSIIAHLQGCAADEQHKHKAFHLIDDYARLRVSKA